jgi:hypothetical protein
MTNVEREKRPVPTAPGYGDQGPAGAGRDLDTHEEAAEPEDQPGPDGPEHREDQR